MNVSDLIESLTKLLAERGDLPVRVYTDGGDRVFETDSVEYNEDVAPEVGILLGGESE